MEEVEADLRKLEVNNLEVVAQDRVRWMILVSEAKMHYSLSHSRELIIDTYISLLMTKNVGLLRKTTIRS